MMKIIQKLMKILIQLQFKKISMKWNIIKKLKKILFDFLILSSNLIIQYIIIDIFVI